jgi:hypothetical protein
MPHVVASSGTARYFVAVASSIVALVVALVLHAWLELTPFQFFLIAVLLTAYFGGMGPALLAASRFRSTRSRSSAWTRW